MSINSFKQDAGSSASVNMCDVFIKISARSENNEEKVRKNDTLVRVKSCVCVTLLAL